MRCQRVRMSISVWSSMCPIWSDPVTFGGGMTMENTGPGALASARKSSSLTQYSAQRGSICCGSYVLGISRAIVGRCSLHQRETHLHVPFHDLGNLRLYEVRSGGVNSAQQVYFSVRPLHPMSSENAIGLEGNYCLWELNSSRTIASTTGFKISRVTSCRTSGFMRA